MKQDNGKKQIQEMILKTVSKGLELANRDSNQLSLQSSLAGADAIVDSVSLVTIIVELEEIIETKFGTTIMIFDGEDINGVDSPFQSIEFLSEHIHALLNAIDLPAARNNGP